MLFFSLQGTLAMVAAAVAVDWIVGDPRWLTHPVIWIGRWIKWLENRLRNKAGSDVGAAVAGTGSNAAGSSNAAGATNAAGIPGGANQAEAAGTGADVKQPFPAPRQLRLRGVVLALSTVLLSFTVTGAIVMGMYAIHPWLGYAANVWLISTTVAVKGLKEAAMLVYRPLSAGRLDEARKYVGYIVGRDTEELDEPEITRAAVETVAENTVDAVVSPLFFALLGGAPLAMLYRATNTLDSMVGYKNEAYLHFGWASARWDDWLNWLPARITGFLLAAAAWLTRGLSAARALKAIRRFAKSHPSPNSGIPESAVAGALGVELGGRNTYGGQISERARMGWPLRSLQREDIPAAVGLLYKVSYLIVGGCLCILVLQRL